MKKKVAKKRAAAKKARKQKSFEETSWDTANKLRGSLVSSVWSEAGETNRQGCTKSERARANRNTTPLLFPSFSLPTSSTKGEGEILEMLVESDLENKAYPLAA